MKSSNIVFKISFLTLVNGKMFFDWKRNKTFNRIVSIQLNSLNFFGCKASNRGSPRRARSQERVFFLQSRVDHILAFWSVA